MDSKNEIQTNPAHRVIFFSGLPKAGKSVTLHALNKMAVESGRGRDIFLERVHPDQEGNWTIETSGGQDMARSIKNSLKAKGEFWSDQFLAHALRSVRGLARTYPIVLADMGGIPSAQNREIVAVAKATATVEAVVLYPEGRDPREWSEFWQREGVAPLFLETRFGAQDAVFEREQARIAEAAWVHLDLGVRLSPGVVSGNGGKEGLQ